MFEAEEKTRWWECHVKWRLFLNSQARKGLRSSRVRGAVSLARWTQVRSEVGHCLEKRPS